MSVSEPSTRPPPGDAAFMLSIDVEEYFQVECAASVIRPADWDNFSSRLDRPIDRILQLLSDHRASATFFVLGWIARRQPRIIQRIVAAGHEIASHGTGHQMITRLSAGEFRSDITDCRKLLEDLAGQPVLGYRAPTFSIMRSTAWALDVLAEAGFRYDSSIFPVRHDRYGVPDAPVDPYQAIGPGGGGILEIPPLTARLPLINANWPVGGGGYLRLLPLGVIAATLANRRRAGRPAMIYLHPWELDPDQPVLVTSRLSRLRHRLGMHSTARKLAGLLRRFSFSAVRPLLPRLCRQAEGHSFRLGAR